MPLVKSACELGAAGEIIAIVSPFLRALGFFIITKDLLFSLALKTKYLVCLVYVAFNLYLSKNKCLVCLSSLALDLYF